jgi:hypothetical protein
VLWLSEKYKKEAEQVLSEALFQPDYNSSPFRHAVIQALGVIGAKDSISAIETGKLLLPKQDWGAAHDVIKMLKYCGDEPQVAKLKMELEKLNEKIRKLEKVDQ